MATTRFGAGERYDGVAELWNCCSLTYLENHLVSCLQHYIAAHFERLADGGAESGIGWKDCIVNYVPFAHSGGWLHSCAHCRSCGIGDAIQLLMVQRLISCAAEVFVDTLAPVARATRV